MSLWVGLSHPPLVPPARRAALAGAAPTAPFTSPGPWRKVVVVATAAEAGEGGWAGLTSEAWALGAAEAPKVGRAASSLGLSGSSWHLSYCHQCCSFLWVGEEGTGGNCAVVPPPGPRDHVRVPRGTDHRSVRGQGVRKDTKVHGDSRDPVTVLSYAPGRRPRAQQTCLASEAPSPEALPPPSAGRRGRDRRSRCSPSSL